MQIALPTNPFTRVELNAALEREIRTGFQLKKETERRRELRAAEDAKTHAEIGKKNIPGLGRCVATMPHWEFYRLIQKYGHKEVHSKEFMSFFQRKFPHLSPNKI